MRKKELICVICPNGCQLEATLEKGREIQIRAIDGELCEKGLKWAEQELINPMRTITSNMLVVGGELPLVSVRTDSPIPMADIFEVMKVIRSARAEAPIKIGETLIKNPAGIPCNVIATRNVNEIDPSIP